jgi:tetratricopeptide (TPR) repeat protein
MSVRRTHLAFLAAAFLPLVAACGNDKQPVTTTIRGSSGGPTTTVATDSGAPSGTVTETTAATVPVSYVDAEAAYTARKYAEAAELFDSYTRANPENAWGHYMFGLSSWKAGDPEQAMTGFDEALRIDPQHRKSLLNSARVLLDTGRPREALERVERAMTIEPLSAEGLRLLGRSRYELKQVPEAIDAYQRAVVLDERDVWALNNLGLIYIQQDRSEAAVPVLARAVELRSDSPVFQNNLGTALERTGHYAAAKKAYESALAADSTYGKASASLARVTPLAAGDSSAVDPSTFVAEFHAELERWQDLGQAVDTTAVDTAQAVE